MSTLHSNTDAGRNGRPEAEPAETLDEKLNEWIGRHVEEAVDTLRELIRIPSVQGDPVPVSPEETYPYGQAVQDAFAYMLALGEEAGFRTLDADHYAGHIAFAGSAERAGGPERAEAPDDASTAAGRAEAPDMSESEAAPEVPERRIGSGPVGVLAHLDVVPAGDGWQSDPFGGARTENGMICGRGAQDDKGPLLAAFFGMRALKEIGWNPKREIRLIMGLDEETDTGGIQHYLKEASAPAVGFTPDSAFPVIHGEKGILEVTLAKKLGRSGQKGLELRKLSGGDALNVVPQAARALVHAPKASRYDQIMETAASYSAETGYTLKTRRSGKSLEIRAIGTSAHASQPEKGRNAISILLDFLGRLDFANDDVNDFIQFYNEHIGFRTDGSGLGLRAAPVELAQDQEADGALGHAAGEQTSGRQLVRPAQDQEADGAPAQDAAPGKLPEEPDGLTMSPDLLRFDREAVSVSCDIRYPVSTDGDTVCRTMMPWLDQYDMGLVKAADDPPLWFPADHPLVETLMQVYREETGDAAAVPVISGGGTYARACSGIVAFGALFPGDEDRMHMSDEQISVKRYLQLIRIYAKALVRLSELP